MLRWIVLASLAVLGGCATTSYDYYADGRYYEQSADDYDDGYYAGGYVSTSYGYGDYYYGGVGYDPYFADYWAWPGYYSLFWPLQHGFIDPWYYPGYYYGVTYYPVGYFDVSYRYAYGGSWYGAWYYSPYRGSWADSYYDWYPWTTHNYYRHDDHHRRDHFGSARNEAERLAERRRDDRGSLSRVIGVNPSRTSVDGRGPRSASYPVSRSYDRSQAARTGGLDRRDQNRSGTSARDDLIRMQHDRNAQVNRSSVDRGVPIRNSRGLLEASRRDPASTYSKPARVGETVSAPVKPSAPRAAAPVVRQRSIRYSNPEPREASYGARDHARAGAYLGSPVQPEPQPVQRNEWRRDEPTQREPAYSAPASNAREGMIRNVPRSRYEPSSAGYRNASPAPAPSYPQGSLRSSPQVSMPVVKPRSSGSSRSSRSRSSPRSAHKGHDDDH